jgi:hypothetical protein
MPPEAVIPDKTKGWSFDLPKEQRWIVYLANHPDAERLTKHDQEWRQTRAEWLRRTGATTPYVI